MFVATAAVADFRPRISKSFKIKKDSAPDFLKLTPNPDILATVAHGKKKQFCVGFSLEDRKNALALAREKMRRKNCDLMVLNSTAAMESDCNQLTVLFPDGALKKLPRQKKMRAATNLCKIIAAILP